MRVYLFGYLSDDFFGRVVVTPAGQTIERLAAQLTAWGPGPEWQGPSIVVNEAGGVLDPHLTITEAGLGNGAIFTVVRGA